MQENPYESTATRHESSPPTATDSSKPLWIAYAFSPAVTPVAFVAMLFVLGAVLYAFDLEVNPASFLILPVLVLTVGFVVCYLIAGCIGMPIAFYLRRRNSLTAFTIHMAAFCWSVFVAIMIALSVALSSDTAWYEVPIAIFVITLVVAPPVLLSATSFWLIVRSYGALSTAR